MAVEMRSKETVQGFVVPADPQKLSDWHRGMDLVDLTLASESTPIELWLPLCGVGFLSS